MNVIFFFDKKSKYKILITKLKIEDFKKDKSLTLGIINIPLSLSYYKIGSKSFGKSTELGQSLQKIGLSLYNNKPSHA